MVHYIAPVLLVAAVLATGAGQYVLTARADGPAGLALFSLGFLAFAGALVGLRQFPGEPDPPRQLARRPSPRFAFGLAATLSLTLALVASEWAQQWLLAIGSWLLSLLLALLAAGGVSRRSAWGALGQRSVHLVTWARQPESLAALLVFAIGAALRWYRLDAYPSGIHGDEAEFGLIVWDMLAGKGPHPFGTAFLGDPALYLYAQAPFQALFGLQTVVGLRAFSALVGALTVPAFYLLLRALFGGRVALLGAALLAGSAVHVNFSRLALNVAEVPLLSSLALYALWRANCAQVKVVASPSHQREGQGVGGTTTAVWWLLAGMLSALAVYFHFGGRILAVVMAGYVAYLLVTRPSRWRAWLGGSLVALLGAAMTLAPLALHLASKPGAFGEHVGGRLIWNDWPRVMGSQKASSIPEALVGQLRTNVQAFIAGVDASQFYTFAGYPLLAPLLGSLFALGLMLVAWRARDRRYGLLFTWFWISLVLGGVVTQDAPQAHRLLPAVLPALAGIALVLDLVAAAAVRYLGPAVAPVALGVALAVPAAAGFADQANYFGRGAAALPWEPTTVQGRYVASLGPGVRVYSAGMPNTYFTHSVTRFLAPTTPGGDLHNPALLPLPVPGDRDLVFLVYPHMMGYQPLISAIYPGGETTVVPSVSGGAVFTAYRVPRQQVARFQGVTARYPGSERIEYDPDALGGGATAYPAQVTWTANIYAATQGSYVLLVDDPSAELRLDGQPVRSGAATTLGTGWHQLEVRTTLKDAAARVQLAWQQPGESAPGPVANQWLEARSLPLPLRAVTRPERGGGLTIERLDQAIGFRNLIDLARVPLPAISTWQGTLDVPAAGRYRFAINASGEATLRIGDHLVASTRGSSGFQSANGSIQLEARQYPLAVALNWRAEPGLLEVFWTPPGGQQQLLLPGTIPPAGN